MSEVTAVAVEAVTFFSWMGWDDKEKRAYPSSMAINISGGQTRVANDGTKVRNPNKVAQFHNGSFITDDPEIIAALRKLSSKADSTITEDREVYYQKVMKAEEKNRRNQNLIRQQNEDLAAEKRENSRLRAMLEEQGRQTPPRRSREA